MMVDEDTWEAAETPKIFTNCYEHFGLLIPCKSGVAWEQQTGGVCCNHVRVEGIFIPAEQPYEIRYKDKNGEMLPIASVKEIREQHPDWEYGKDYNFERVNLLPILVKANYDGQPDKPIWDRIWKAMHATVEFAEEPEEMPEDAYWDYGQPFTEEYPRYRPTPHNCEAFQWVVLKDFEEGWGHQLGIEKESLPELMRRPLILLYPNCD